MQTELFSKKAYFSEEAIKEKAQSLAEITTSVSELKERKAALASQLNSEIQVLTQRAATLSRHITQGYEFIDVECRVEIRENENVVDLIEIKSGEVVGSRSLTDEDQQLGMPF